MQVTEPSIQATLAWPECKENRMRFHESHTDIRDTVRNFVINDLNPFVDEWEEAKIFPAHEVFKKMGDLGLLGVSRDEAYGGLGLDYSHSMVMAEELGICRAAAVSMAIGVHTDMYTCACQLWHGSLETKSSLFHLSVGMWSDVWSVNRVGLRCDSLRPLPPKMVMTTLSEVGKCGSPTECKPIGCAAWSIHLKANPT